jgi:hypothetical protein
MALSAKIGVGLTAAAALAGVTWYVKQYLPLQNKVADLFEGKDEVKELETILDPIDDKETEKNKGLGKSSAQPR